MFVDGLVGSVLREECHYQTFSRSTSHVSQAENGKTHGKTIHHFAVESCQDEGRMWPNAPKT